MEHGNLVLARHGQTEWSARGKHTSHTDVDLTTAGEEQARALGPALAGFAFADVRCSPRLRARRTAELAGLAVTSYEVDLVEWDYGRYEGRTTAEIQAERPDWSLWTDGCPDGESPADVQIRVDRLLASRHGETLFVAHGHILRVVAARWLGLPVAAGALFALEPAGVGELGYEHGRPVIRRWN